MKSRLLLLLLVQTGLTVVIMAGLLFGGAGDLRWPQAWVYLAIFVLCSVVFGVWLNKRDPALLAERLGSPVQHGQPLWDRIFLLVFITLWLAWMLLMGLDGGRWHRGAMTVWVNAAGALLVIGGFLGVCRVFAENSFAAPVVRVQSERDQRVIDTGPYAVVRHPMYAAALFYLLGMPLLLGSWDGVAALPIVLAGLVPRALQEERMLARELPGYADYMQRVRFRLIPGIW